MTYHFAQLKVLAVRIDYRLGTLQFQTATLGVDILFVNQHIHYIGKEHLGLTPEELPIKDGDIVALVTTIEGLDVTHLGFAIWRGETLHLMHASMKHRKVVIDERSLYEYLQDRKSCPGVRVVRLRER